MTRHRNNCHLSDMKPSFEKEQFKEFKMNFVNEIVRFVQGNRVCLTDAAYLLVK